MMVEDPLWNERSSIKQILIVEFHIQRLEKYIASEIDPITDMTLGEFKRLPFEIKSLYPYRILNALNLHLSRLERLEITPVNGDDGFTAKVLTGLFFLIPLCVIYLGLSLLRRILLACLPKRYSYLNDVSGFVNQIVGSLILWCLLSIVSLYEIVNQRIFELGQ
jgi:hypothetical protein